MFPLFLANVAPRGRPGLARVLPGLFAWPVNADLLMRLISMPRVSLTMMRRLLLLCMLIGASAHAASAQISELERSRYRQAAYYNYAEPGDLTVTVNVWGAVANPGLYEVPQETRLSRLFSLAGGPSTGAQQRGSRRDLTVSLSREQPASGERELIFEQDMEDDIIVFEQDPLIQEGDVLTVETYTQNRFTWRDALPIIGAATSVASTILTIVAIQRND